MFQGMSSPAPAGDDSLCFGEFCLLPRQRLLLANGTELPLNGRALDILTLLVDRSGRFVTNAELMAHAWPHSVVEGISLRVHIAALRRVLESTGARYIENSIGQGYRFVAPVSREAAWPRHRLPAPLSSLIGRARTTDAVTGLVQRHRWVTLVGAAGTGKSALALAVATGLIARFTSGACLVDLSMSSDLHTLAVRIAHALDLAPLAGAAPDALTRALHDRHVLLVLDNCDLALAAVASLTETLLARTTRLHVLSTSRELLGGASEQQFRVTPLDPASSVDLFMARASAFAPTDATGVQHADLIVDLCRRLDGIPLVIELAASQVTILGLRGLASRLATRMLDMSNGRRTADPRHRSWRAALEWAFETLSEAERSVLMQLGGFEAEFTFAEVVALAVRWQGSPRETAACLLSLAGKSLIETGLDGNTAFHRLLEPIKVYARDKGRV